MRHQCIHLSMTRLSCQYLQYILIECSTCSVELDTRLGSVNALSPLNSGAAVKPTSHSFRNRTRQDHDAFCSKLSVHTVVWQQYDMMASRCWHEVVSSYSSRVYWSCTYHPSVLLLQQHHELALLSGTQPNLSMKERWM